MHSKDGDRLYRFIEVKIFAPGNKTFQRKLLRAPAHKGFLKEAVDKTIEEYAERLDETSELEYRMVEVAPNRVNFVCEGAKPPQCVDAYANQQSAAEMALGAAE